MTTTPLARTALAALGAAALALPLALSTPSASAGTAPPPCTKKAIKKAIQASEGATVTVDSKRCKNYWAAATYTVEGEFDAAALLEDNGGAWKVVKPKREARLCSDTNTKVPNMIKKRACVS